MWKRIASALYRLGDAVGGLESRAERESRRGAMDVLRKIARDGSQRFEEAEKEASRRSREGLLDMAPPDRWRSRFYLRQGYRVRECASAEQNHFRGGSPYHDGAECPICKKPLLLFWDIDCRDPRFKQESPEMFGTLQRLPLYYCCRRPEPTIYQVLPKNQLRTYTPQLETDEESPFRDFPDTFERRPIELDAIPRDIENLLLIEHEISNDWLTESEQARIGEYIAPQRFSEFSQFGGMPRMGRRDERIACPNPECLTHRMGHPIGRHEQQYAMKELAVIEYTSGFEMETNCTDHLSYLLVLPDNSCGVWMQLKDKDSR